MCKAFDENYQGCHTTRASAIHYTEGKVKLPCRGWIKRSDSRDHVGEMDD